MKYALFVALLWGLLLAACDGTAPVPTSTPGATLDPIPTKTLAPTPIAEATATPSISYTRLSVSELQQMLKEKDFLLVNVYVPFEGNLPQTDLSIPYNQIDQHPDELPDKDARIVLYCRSGSVSAIAAKRLVEIGFTHIYTLQGGFDAWEQAGLPMEEQP